jgi:hypothetical protein
MAYIGSQQGRQSAVLLDSISIVNGQAAYTMQKGGVNYSPASELMLNVSLNGLVQAPSNSFTISGSTITFADPLVTGDVIDYILDREPTTGTMEPLDASVTADKIASSVMRNGIRVNGATLSTNTTIASSERAMVAGDFTIASGTTLLINGEMSIV